MEILLIFNLLFSPSAGASELDRFEKRARGFAAHEMQEEAEARRREEASEKFRGSRQKYEEKFIEARKTFKRHLWVRDESQHAAFLRDQEERDEKHAQIQKKYADEHVSESRIIDKKSEVLKPREYKIESSRP